MLTFLKENWFKIIIAITILSIGFSISFYFLNYLPKINVAKIEQKKWMHDKWPTKRKNDFEKSTKKFDDSLNREELNFHNFSKLFNKNTQLLDEKKRIIDKQDDSSDNCVLPKIWEEVKYIFKDCKLQEIEKSTNHKDTFSFNGGNGSFDYCNTLLFTKYLTVKGELYTYTKERYKHYPNSEVGEYRIPKLLYDEMTNSKTCIPEERNGVNISNDDLSSESFPSRNLRLDEDIPCYWASFFNRHYKIYRWSGNHQRQCYY